MQFPEDPDRDFRRSRTSKRRAAMTDLEESTPPSASRLWLGMLARLAAVLALVVIVDLAGLAASGDAWLRARYYDLRGQRASSQRVVLVGLDAPAAPDQMATLVARIEHGK